MKTKHGHTLVELMLCLLIGGIVLGLALPSFSALLNSSTQAQLTNQLLGQLHYARGTAVLGKTTVALCAGQDRCSGSSNWQRQLLVFIDQNGNGQLDPAEKLLRQEPLRPDYSWQWSSFRHRSYVLFDSDGTTRALNGTFTLCENGTPLKQIVISVSGRPRTQSPSPDARCS
ncbi:Type II transport protein GspH [compost metagenome]